MGAVLRGLCALAGALLIAACTDTLSSGAGGVGQPLPTFEVSDMQGRRGGFAALHGRVTVINVWATWCGPCRDEMESLNRLHGQTDPAQVAVVGISVDDDPRLLDEYLRRHSIAFPVWLDPGMRALRAALGVQSVPETIVVAPDGRVVARVRGSRDWSGQQARALVDRALGR